MRIDIYARIRICAPKYINVHIYISDPFPLEVGNISFEVEIEKLKKMTTTILNILNFSILSVECSFACI